MLLAVDIGNTNTVVGLFADGVTDDGDRAVGELPGLLRHWRVSTVVDRTPDELALLLDSLLATAGTGLPATVARLGLGGPGVTGVALSSSVPPLTGTIRETIAEHLAVPTVIVEPGIRTGMPVRYENPREVGADRIVNAVAALDLYGAPAIVVDLGTATTFDVISAAGEYLGGAIVPGLQISLDALVERAAALQRVELREAPRNAIGRTTAESIRSGVIFGAAAMVDGLCQRIEEELGSATIIATGGLGAIVVPHTRRVVAFEPWLTLHGLRLLFDRNVTDEERLRG